MKQTITWVVVLVVILAGGYYFFVAGDREDSDAQMNDEEAGEMMKRDEDTATMMNKEDASSDAMMKEVDEEMMKGIMALVSFQYEGKLSDVTEGATVRGVTTDGEATGVARANFENGSYSLHATFEGLPELQGDDFYEGWIVRKGVTFDVISTGPAEVMDGVYTNTYASGDDLTDHNFYVLTLEPNDGDPAPSDYHVLEGTMDVDDAMMMEEEAN